MAKAKKTASGKWRVQATAYGQTRSFTAETRKAAELAAVEWQTGKSPYIDKITLRDAYERYISEREKVLSPSTVKAYRSMQKHTLQGIMCYRLSELNTHILQQEINALTDGHTPKYVKNAYGLFSAVIEMFAPDLKLKVRLPQREKPRLYIPDDNDIIRLLEFVKGDEIEIPIMLAAFGPMRRGEICALTSDDIHGNIVSVNKAVVSDTANVLHIKPPKTFSSYRDIIYPDFVIKRLQAKNGKITTMTPAAITHAFPRVLERAGLPHFRFHDLRHYAVSTLHANNIPDRYIMARGGWSTNHTMNNVYNHLLKSAMDDIENKIETHFDTVYKKTV